MRSLDDYSGFLFDFDGLLVDSERAHHRAYAELLALRDLHLPWKFEEYLVVAHAGQYSLRDAVYGSFPQLKESEPDWERLREEKKALYLEIIGKEETPLMPGAAELLTALFERRAPLCVVTHSERGEVERIRKSHPILEQIPRWITREEYPHAKPHPSGYQFAAAELGASPADLIGFEDSPRGVVALQEAGIGTPVWVAPASYGGKRDFLKEGTLQVESLARVFDLGKEEATCGSCCRS